MTESYGVLKDRTIPCLGPFSIVGLRAIDNGPKHAKLRQMKSLSDYSGLNPILYIANLYRRQSLNYFMWKSVADKGSQKPRGYTRLAALKGDAGLTIIETMFSLVVLVILGGAILRISSLPFLAGHRLDISVTRILPVRALDIVINDLKQADGPSFPYSSINVAAGGTMGWFRRINLSGNPPSTYIWYDFELASPLSGALVRHINDTGPTVAGSSSTVVLDYVLSPTPALPLFQRDPNLSDVILVALAYSPPFRSSNMDSNVFLARRRVTIRN